MGGIRRMWDLLSDREHDGEFDRPAEEFDADEPLIPLRDDDEDWELAKFAREVWWWLSDNPIEWVYALAALGVILLTATVVLS